MNPRSFLSHQSGAADVPSWSHGEGPEVPPLNSKSLGVLIHVSFDSLLFTCWLMANWKRQEIHIPRISIFIETSSLSATDCIGLQRTISSIDLIMLT